MGQEALMMAQSDRRGGGRKRTSDRRHEEADLPLVLREVAELMNAAGALLTMHAEGEPPVALYADPLLGEDRAGWMLGLCHTLRPSFEDGQAFWRQVPQAPGLAVMLLPVERAAGHSRLLISLLFVDADEETRREAERLYVERRPFAIGYFQLWQHNRMLDRRTRALEAVLNQAGFGVVLIDRAMRIAFANTAADTLLQAADGLGRTGDMVRATRLADAVSLQAALAHAATARTDAERRRAPLLAFRRKTAPALIATILPMRAATSEAGDIAAVMYVVDPHVDTSRTLPPLCRLYGLSPVETDLVCHLAGGETLATAAQRMHVKELTARGYLKQIFIKTNTNRQSDLIILMLSGMLRMKSDIVADVITAS